jgi:hypothetical protein
MDTDRVAMIPRRTTAELVLLILAATVGAVLVAGVVTLGAVTLANPAADTTGAVAALTSTITVLVGVIVGYLAGKARNGGHP